MKNRTRELPPSDQIIYDGSPSRGGKERPPVTMPRVTMFIFECNDGKCGRRAYKDVSEAPSIAEVKRVRKNARCARCGSTGAVSLYWDNGWTDEMTIREKAHIDRPIDDATCQTESPTRAPH